MNNFFKWLKIAIAVFCLILLTIGFGFGYLYGNNVNDNCIDKPLAYGVSKLNDMNNVNFTCSCSAGPMIKPFSFNENGLIHENNDFQIISYP